MCNRDSLGIPFGSLERDYSPSNFNLTGSFYDSLFCYFLCLSSMIHFFHSPFSCVIPSCHMTMIINFQSPTMYVLSIYFLQAPNLRMSIGYLQPLVLLLILDFPHPRRPSCLIRATGRLLWKVLEKNIYSTKPGKSQALTWVLRTNSLP